MQYWTDKMALCVKNTVYKKLMNKLEQFFLFFCHGPNEGEGEVKFIILGFPETFVVNNLANKWDQSFVAHR